MVNDSESELPPEDAPDAKPSMMDAVRFVAGFCWFHRKFFLGLLVLAAVGGWVYVTNLDKATKDTEALAQLASDQIPSVEIGGPQQGAPTSDGLPADQQIQMVQPNEDSGQAKPDPKPETETGHSAILDRGKKQELIEHSLALMSRWRRNRPQPATGSVMMSDRIAALKKLMSMELSETERNYTIIGYIESISVLDALNSQNGLGLGGIREALAEIDRLYTNHENKAIAGKANLALAMIPGYDFLVSNDEQELNQFLQEVKTRGPKIFADTRSSAQLVEVSLGILRSTQYRNEVREVVIGIQSMMQQAVGDQQPELCRSFSERIHFGGIEILSLVSKIPNDDAQTRARVKLLFEGLKSAPDSRLDIHLAAAKCIGAYLQLRKYNDAQDLLGHLEKAVSQMTNQSDQEKMLQVVNEIKAELAATKNN